MRLLVINSVCGIQSTGRIAASIAKEYQKKGYECVIAYGRDDVPKGFDIPTYRITSKMDVYRNTLKARLFDNDGFAAKKETITFIKWAERFNPDVVWLHNLHGYYINIEVLFQWLKSRPYMKVYWTLHDCWAFTGHCGYFSYANCEKWRTGCHHCPQKTIYPKSILFDMSCKNYEAKRLAFTNVNNMTIITPSKWLADLVKQSFLKNYPVEVKHNTVDRNVFRPTPSDFREKFQLQNKKVILGVASPWSKRKGLDDFIRLSTMLDDRFAIVLVGLSEKQIAKVPKSIVALPRTSNQKELAEMYSAADVHLVMSKEETFGMTVLESVYCDTIPVVIKGTACEEVVNEYGGYAVKDDLHEIKATIIQICGGGLLILMPRTKSARELAAIYTAADVFVNTTYEDNYPTTNIEAQACGTPCITYDTGGSPESVPFDNVIKVNINALKDKLETLL